VIQSLQARVLVWVPSAVLALAPGVICTSAMTGRSPER
jgi:hypothetical protein